MGKNSNKNQPNFLVGRAAQTDLIVHLRGGGGRSSERKYLRIFENMKTDIYQIPNTLKAKVN